MTSYAYRDSHSQEDRILRVYDDQDISIGDALYVVGKSHHVVPPEFSHRKFVYTP